MSAVPKLQWEKGRQGGTQAAVINKCDPVGQELVKSAGGVAAVLAVGSFSSGESCWVYL